MDNTAGQNGTSVTPGNVGNKTQKSKSLVMSVLAAVAVLGILAAGYFYWQYQDVKNNPNAALEDRNADETSRVLTKLKSVIQIEETDTPTVARVDDPEKLKQANQEFYANVQQGDYLVLYPKRAIIFRESNSQIVNVAPIINTSELNSTSQQTTTQDETEE